MNGLVMDISRLIDRAHFPTPTGIDRYELHYALWVRERLKHPTRKANNSGFIETGRRGAAAVQAKRADKLISCLSQRWSSEKLSPSQAVLLDQIAAAIDGKIGWQSVKNNTGNESSGSIYTLRKSTRLLLNDLVRLRCLPINTSMMHVSHSRLDCPGAFSWLGQSQPSSIFYVHDLIPLSHPEFVRAEEPRRHFRRMETILAHAALVLCNSQATARAFRSFAQEQNRPLPSIAVLPPGIEDCFSSVSQKDWPKPKNCYFVTVGTIEPRKNHILLLRLWQHLVERDGFRAPRLVIVGKRGWENGHVLAMLERCPALRGFVIEVPNLGDAALARLLVGASALLAPSFAEGYGMPISEALAARLPVIASNIPSHREAGGGAIFLDPFDGLSWRTAIDAITASPRQQKPPMSTPHRWSVHFDDLEGLIKNGMAVHHYAAQRAPRQIWSFSPGTCE
ncbi:glycosyltransferase family 4 protein [Mesorhizobium sp. NPDC059025]|uniref:glycosyltransferase family 4 protein n=1 Tax=unclassified Mesorhizobium TaxID=325217 RepID=UPI00366FD3EC